MIHYSFFVLTIVALTVFNVLKLATAQNNLDTSRNVTVVYQTAFSESNYPFILERCAQEDCFDTAQNPK